MRLPLCQPCRREEGWIDAFGPCPQESPSGSRVSLIPTHKGGGRADGAEALGAEEGRGGTQFCLSPGPYPLHVSFPGGAQPSQPDGCDLRGPHPKPSGTPAGPVVPSLWCFLADGCRLVAHLLRAGSPRGLEGCELAGFAPDSLLPPSQGPEGSH